MFGAIKRNKRSLLVAAALLAALIVLFSFVFYRGEIAVLAEGAGAVFRKISALLGMVPVWTYSIAIFILPIFFFPVSLIFMIAGNKAACGECSFLEVYIFCAIGLVVNMFVSYYIAAFFGGRIGEFLKRRNFSIPQVDSSDENEIILLVRMIPGNPLIVQNYLLGLARVDFTRYAAISVPFQLVTLAAYMYFGESVFAGDFAGVSMAVSLIVVLALIARIVSKRYSRRAKNV